MGHRVREGYSQDLRANENHLQVLDLLGTFPPFIPISFSFLNSSAQAYACPITVFWKLTCLVSRFTAREEFASG